MAIYKFEIIIIKVDRGLWIGEIITISPGTRVKISQAITALLAQQPRT